MHKITTEVLIEILYNARSAAEQYVKKELSEPREVDFDAYSYVFIRIDGRNKRFWNSLVECSKFIKWIDVNSETKTIQIYPEISLAFNRTDSGMNKRIAEVLNIEGIPCFEHTRYRN